MQRRWTNIFKLRVQTRSIGFTSAYTFDSIKLPPSQYNLGGSTIWTKRCGISLAAASITHSTLTSCVISPMPHVSSGVRQRFYLPLSIYANASPTCFTFTEKMLPISFPEKSHMPHTLTSLRLKHIREDYIVVQNPRAPRSISPGPSSTRTWTLKTFQTSSKPSRRTSQLL